MALLLVQMDAAEKHQYEYGRLSEFEVFNNLWTCMDGLEIHHSCF